MPEFNEIFDEYGEFRQNYFGLVFDERHIAAPNDVAAVAQDESPWSTFRIIAYSCIGIVFLLILIFSIKTCVGIFSCGHSYSSVTLPQSAPVINTPAPTKSKFAEFENMMTHAGYNAIQRENVLELLEKDSLTIEQAESISMLIERKCPSGALRLIIRTMLYQNSHTGLWNASFFEIWRAENTPIEFKLIKSRPADEVKHFDNIEDIVANSALWDIGHINGKHYFYAVRPVSKLGKGDFSRVLEYVESYDTQCWAFVKDLRLQESMIQAKDTASAQCTSTVKRDDTNTSRQRHRRHHTYRHRRRR